MAPLGFPFVPAPVQDLPFLALVVLLSSFIVAGVISVFVLGPWQARHEKAERLIEEMPPRMKKAA